MLDNNENETQPEAKLEVAMYDLDSANRAARINESNIEREVMRRNFEEEILVRNDKFDYLMELFWNNVQVPLSQVKSIYSDSMVENYSIDVTNAEIRNFPSAHSMYLPPAVSSAMIDRYKKQH